MVSVTSRSRPATRARVEAASRRRRAARSVAASDRPGQQDGELLALHAGEQRLRRGVLAQQPGGHQQQLVAGGVPQGVGDLGVVAQRREDEAGPRHRDRVGRRSSCVDLGGQPLPVGQPGQPVVVGVVADLGEQLLLADGGVDVGQHRVQRGAVAVGEGDDVAAPVAHLEVAGLAGGGRHRSAEQVGDPAAGERRRLLARRRVPAETRTGPSASRGRGRRNDVVGVARAVVPDRRRSRRRRRAGAPRPGRAGSQSATRSALSSSRTRLRRSAGCRPRRRRPAPRGGRSRRRARALWPSRVTAPKRRYSSARATSSGAISSQAHAVHADQQQDGQPDDDRRPDRPARRARRGWSTARGRGSPGVARDGGGDEQRRPPRWPPATATR